MNLPNKLTIARIILIPAFMALYIHGYIFASVAVFALASATDWLDGYLARKNGIVTNFGKFMDPLADKLLITGALLCLLQSGVVSLWAVMIILAREFLVTGLRLVAAAEGIVISAGGFGKLKTVLQIAAVITAVFLGKSMITDVMVYIATLLTAVSGINYIVQNRKVFLNKS